MYLVDLDAFLLNFFFENTENITFITYFRKMERKLRFAMKQL